MSGSHLVQILPASESSHITQVIAQVFSISWDEDPMTVVGTDLLNDTTSHNKKDAAFHTAEWIHLSRVQHDNSSELWRHIQFKQMIFVHKASFNLEFYG